MFGLEVGHLWLIAAVGCCLLEVLGTGLFLMSLGAAAAVTSVFAFLDFDIYWQLGVFSIASILSFLASRRLAERFAHSEDHVPTNVQALIGMQGVVTAPITEMQAGYVKLGGEEWRALPDGGGAGWDTGSRVEVRRLEGNTVYVLATDESQGGEG